jgi:Uma2 family endonuclease
MTAGPRHWRIDHPTPKPGGYTVADLLGIVLDMPYELVDGEIVLRAPTTQWHDEAMILLRGGFAPVPDVLAIDRAKVQAASLTFSPGDARLVVEVVSPGTRTKDRKHRPMDYAGVGIRNFWLVEHENDAMWDRLSVQEPLPGGRGDPRSVLVTAAPHRSS